MEKANRSGREGSQSAVRVQPKPCFRLIPRTVWDILPGVKERRDPVLPFARWASQAWDKVPEQCFSTCGS